MFLYNLKYSFSVCAGVGHNYPLETGIKTQTNLNPEMFFFILLIYYIIVCLVARTSDRPDFAATIALFILWQKSSLFIDFSQALYFRRSHASLLAQCIDASISIEIILG